MRHYLRNITGIRLRHHAWRHAIVGTVLVGALAFAGFAVSASLGPVGLGPTGPNPPTITAGWGDTIVYVNNDTIPHGITGSRPELQSPPIAPGATYTTILTGRTATYPYRQTGQKNVNLKGAVVSIVSGTVTLKASKPLLLYGQTVQLSGTASLDGTPVALQQRLQGQRGWRPLQTLTSGDDGSFSTTYKPAVNAKYRTTIANGQIVSGIAVVAVKPKLTISSQAKATKARHTIKIYSRITPSKAATQITLYQCNASRGAWTRVAGKKPGSSGGVAFLWAAPVGKNYLKTTVSRVDTTTGYVPPTSSTITVKGVGKAPVRKHKPRRTPKPC